MLSVKIAATGLVLIAFALLFVKNEPTVTKVPDWFKLVIVILFFGGVIAFFGGLIATIWTH